MKKQHFISTVILYIIAVFYLAITTPITPHEANIYYNQNSIVSFFMHYGEQLIDGFLGLRIFFIFFSFLSMILFYRLSKNYFKEKKYTYLSTSLFMLLPGVLTATVLADVSIIALLLVLLFVNMYEEDIFWTQPFIMFALFFVHESSIIFFIALLFYSITHKDKKLFTLASSFLIAFIYLSKGIEIGGRPSGHFLEIFGLYATVFTPFIFFYFFYAMYRILLREKKTLLWYISFTALALSLLLSIRQRVYITDFAPYVTISIILMLDIFNHSIDVRLPEFQKLYKRSFYVVIFFLILSDLVIVSNKISFYNFKNPSKHFAYRIYEPYILAKKLKLNGINCYNTINEREANQLRYYHIGRCDKRL